jgi:hypothetical protein
MEKRSRMITRIGSIQDISGIIALQKANLYDNLTEQERKQGFVTTPFSESLLLQLVAERGIFVAEDRGEITGYAMAGTWEYFSKWPIFPYMVSRLGSLSFLGKRLSPEQSFQYGPVCINSVLRGSGLFPLLFEEMRLEFASRFPVGITFINRVNERSYAAHTRKLGMTVIDTFEFSGRNYFMLAFDTTHSAEEKI